MNKKEISSSKFVGYCETCGLMLAETDRRYTDSQIKDCDEYKCPRCRKVSSYDS